jgi:hypothetical protein
MATATIVPMVSKDTGYKARLVADRILHDVTAEQVAGILAELHITANLNTIAAVTHAVKQATINIRDDDGSLIYFSQ